MRSLISKPELLLLYGIVLSWGTCLLLCVFSAGYSQLQMWLLIIGIGLWRIQLTVLALPHNPDASGEISDAN